MTKTYIFPDGKKAVFEYDHNGVGKITLECMNMLMRQLIAYKWCIQSRSFWDAKHCDGCIFYDDCPFNPREDETENSSEKPNNCEPQTDCGDFADRLAYERGVKHAWEVAQKVFGSTVTFYEAEDVAKQIDKDINVRSKDEPQTERSE